MSIRPVPRINFNNHSKSLGLSKKKNNYKKTNDVACKTLFENKYDAIEPKKRSFNTLFVPYQEELPSYIHPAYYQEIYNPLQQYPISTWDCRFTDLKTTRLFDEKLWEANILLEGRDLPSIEVPLFQFIDRLWYNLEIGGVRVLTIVLGGSAATSLLDKKIPKLNDKDIWIYINDEPSEFLNTKNALLQTLTDFNDNQFNSNGIANYQNYIHSLTRECNIKENSIWADYKLGPVIDHDNIRENIPFVDFKFIVNMKTSFTALKEAFVISPYIRDYDGKVMIACLQPNSFELASRQKYSHLLTHPQPSLVKNGVFRFFTNITRGDIPKQKKLFSTFLEQTPVSHFIPSLFTESLNKNLISHWRTFPEGSFYFIFNSLTTLAQFRCPLWTLEASDVVWNHIKFLKNPVGIGKILYPLLKANPHLFNYVVAYLNVLFLYGETQSITYRTRKIFIDSVNYLQIKFKHNDQKACLLILDDAKSALRTISINQDYFDSAFTTLLDLKEILTEKKYDTPLDLIVLKLLDLKEYQEIIPLFFSYPQLIITLCRSNENFKSELKKFIDDAVNGNKNLLSESDLINQNLLPSNFSLLSTPLKIKTLETLAFECINFSCINKSQLFWSYLNAMHSLTSTNYNLLSLALTLIDQKYINVFQTVFQIPDNASCVTEDSIIKSLIQSNHPCGLDFAHERWKISETKSLDLLIEIFQQKSCFLENFESTFKSYLNYRELLKTHRKTNEQLIIDSNIIEKLILTKTLEEVCAILQLWIEQATCPKEKLGLLKACQNLLPLTQTQSLKWLLDVAIKNSYQ
ncbi:MAG: hypothetical protein JHC93_07730, partial [Parachlamydiales bacterium]|nr:hypothetical protein [Parachlamydiales bacterium]